MISKKQIIIGTSGWGSKISYNKSLELGNKLTSFGINQFDTAPTYGAGCAHHILNTLSKENRISVNTKYGEITKLNLKEIIKRIYRYHNINIFKKSFDFVKINKKERLDKKFWNISNIEQYLIKFTQDLNNCEIKILYLHSPPYKILDKEYLNKLIQLMSKYNILLGVSWPDFRDLELLSNNFPNIAVQISLNTFSNLKIDIYDQMRVLHINSIFKNSSKKKVHQNKFSKEITNFLKKNENYSVVLGINSYNSITNLKQLLIK